MFFLFGWCCLIGFSRFLFFLLKRLCKVCVVFKIESCLIGCFFFLKWFYRLLFWQCLRFENINVVF